MKIIAKTSDGYLIQATDAEVMGISGGALPIYERDSMRLLNHTGRTVNVINTAGHIKKLKQHREGALQAATLIKAFAAHPDVKASTIKRGQTVWLSDGREAEYIAKVGDAHMVREVVEVETYDGTEKHPGSVFEVTAVYHKAPRAVIDAEVAEARKTLAEVRKQINLANAELSNAKREVIEAKRLRNADPVLKFLDGMLTGDF